MKEVLLMGIFQKSVINNHLSKLDVDKVDNAFDKFRENYSPTKISEIIKLKEEEYQDGFLRDIFVDLFGYTLKPANNYDLAREFKNLSDGKKADGAILKNENAIAVIELKSTKTKDLTSITQQAFNYKNNQPECKYVITSNFQKLRFYIDYANEYEEFDLFNLQKSEFRLLYLLLHKDSIFSDLPLKLKTETKFHEENISDKLYKDYSAFKHKVFKNLVKNNPQFDKLILFKKSQKFLDRLLFVFFAEDTGLVPPNAISKIIEQWQLFIDNDEYFSLYSRFVKFFSHLNKGHKYKTYDLPAYNGGLFAPDEILDNVVIDDEILKDDALLLSSYDYSTEVDVNILGHIFEHSLNEIEEITAEIEGSRQEKTKTKRKKDGVFYTPKYITQYIVENTIGKLCAEKRKELNITEIEFEASFKTKSGKLSANGKKLFDILQSYKEWLFELKIVDPACGSGAFLNQALIFLIAEHKQIDDIIAELTGEAIRLFDTDKTILEKNLYGVDINEESVEIAKLSLWLHTAQRGRTLSDLSGNIKCGNSLIDDPEIAGGKAFNWEKEFPQVFSPQVNEKVLQKMPKNKPDYAKLIKEKARKAEELANEALEISKQVYEYAAKMQEMNEPSAIYGTKKGGFDVVLGNPPYVRSRGSMQDDEKRYFADNYKTISYQPDLYKLFIEKSVNILKKNGLLSFITPSVFLSNDYDKPLRKFILNENYLREISISDEDIFKDASVKTVVFVIKKTISEELIYFNKIEKGKFYNIKVIPKEVFVNQDYVINENIDFNSLGILNKMNKLPKLGEFCDVKNGIKVRKELLFDKKIDNNYKPFLLGKDINICLIDFDETYIHYIDENEKLYTNQAFRSKYIFEQEKLIVRQILGKRIVTTYDDNFYYTDQTTYVLNCKSKYTDLKYLLPIFNSKLLYYYFKNTFSDNKVNFPKVKRSQILKFPIKTVKDQTYFIEKSNNLLDYYKSLHQKKIKFLNRLRDNLEIEKISKKLEAFYDYDFKTLLAELKKQKIKLSLANQDEWGEYFNTYKTEINHLQNQIAQTDKQIDQMVYELYELTEEEIRIVEESI